MKYLLSFFVVLIFAGTVYASGQIDISYAGYTVTQPGSYIVVADLHAVADQDAITIETSDVTIDLNGHVLYGAGTATGSTGSGVYNGSGYANIAVYNGTVRDFRHYGIYLDGENHQVSRIRAYANGSYGIYIGTNGTVWDNTVRKNLDIGIQTGSGCVIRDNSVRENALYGIIASTGSTVTGNSVIYSSGDGIYTGYGCTVTGNSAYNSGGNGIATGAGCTVTGNSVIYSVGDGINADTGSTVKDNTVERNTGNGIQVSTDCQVVGNTCDKNGYGTATGAGIRVNNVDNIIENNTLTDNDMGLYISSAGNFYAGNRASGNSISNYSTVGAQTAGDGTNGPTNVSFYHQPNLMIQYFVGFDIPIFRESPDAVIRNLIW